MLTDLKKQLQSFLSNSLLQVFPSDTPIPHIEIEVPSDKQHGDFSTNIALKSAKIFKKAPLVIAQELKDTIESKMPKELSACIEKVDIKAPGFINFYLSKENVQGIIGDVLEKGAEFGSSSFGQGKKVQIEFVSANPTGPLSIAHARQAAVGDSLGNVLKTIGFQVTKEYYINDGGNQINILGRSIQLRGCEIFGETIEFPEEGYQGDYISDMAKIFIDQKGVKDLNAFKAIDVALIRQFGVDYLLDVIKTELADFHVHFDQWSHESKIATKEAILDVIELLTQKGLTKDEEGALWFSSTQFGDDKDRVLRKSDGSYTYLTPDIVYHRNKFDRGFDYVFNIWGPDHHGYIPRIKAAAQALGKNPEALEVLIVQLATIYRDGKAVSMSTRRGQYISLREVLEEVGADAARFFFLMRHINVHLDFDLELAKKQTPDNPVYYIQYAHARVYSINDKAKETNIQAATGQMTRLVEEEEQDLIKKLGFFEEALLQCHKQLDPYPVVSYLQELAALFHRFYDKHRVVVEDSRLASERLALMNAAGVVIERGLKLLGISAPRKM